MWGWWIRVMARVALWWLEKAIENCLSELFSSN